MFYQLVFNRKKKFNNKGQAPIEIRITKDRRVTYFSTKIYIKLDQWNNRALKINRRHDNNVRLNRWLHYKINETEAYETECEMNGEIISHIHLKEFLSNNEKTSITFPEWCKKTLEDDNKIDTSTKKKKLVLVNRLFRFNKNLTFKNLNYSFLREFENFLHGEINYKNGKPIQQVTIHSQMKILKTFLNLAKREGKIDFSTDYKVKKGENPKEALNIDEVKRIEELDITEPFLKKVQDMFLFCCYTGIRYGDMAALNKNNIRTTEEGIEIHFKMRKVGKTITLPLFKLFEGKSEKIFLKYAVKNHPTIFESKSNQTVNRNLKIIKFAANIEKPLTFNISRHTCLTLIGQKTGNSYPVMKIAGHSDIKISMKYTQGVVDKRLFDLL